MSLLMSVWVQGTAATALAGLYGALTVQGKPLEALRDQRICVVGAGSAGMGVTQMIASGMQKHVSRRHMPDEHHKGRPGTCPD